MPFINNGNTFCKNGNPRQYFKHTDNKYRNTHVTVECNLNQFHVSHESEKVRIGYMTKNRYHYGYVDNQVRPMFWESARSRSGNTPYAKRINVTGMSEKETNIKNELKDVFNEFRSQLGKTNGIQIHNFSIYGKKSKSISPEKKTTSKLPSLRVIKNIAKTRKSKNPIPISQLFDISKLSKKDQKEFQKLLLSEIVKAS